MKGYLGMRMGDVKMPPTGNVDQMYVEGAWRVDKNFPDSEHMVATSKCTDTKETKEVVLLYASISSTI